MFHLEQTTFKSDMLESFSHNKRAKTPDNRCIKYETVKKKKSLRTVSVVCLIKGFANFFSHLNLNFFFVSILLLFFQIISVKTG